jgi:hypothetical protein
MEHAVLKHLEAGEVLCEGKWVGFDLCKSMLTNGANTDAPETAAPPQSDAFANDADVDNKKAVPWTVVSLSTGKRQTASENMAPLVQEIGDASDSYDETPDAWENSSKSQFKIIALVSSAILLLSLAVFIAIRLVF